MQEQQKESFREMRSFFAQALGAIPPHAIRKKPGMDEVIFNVGALVSGSPKKLGDFIGIATFAGLENFSVNKTPQGVEFVVRGYESLNMLADMGCNFPGSSDYKSSEISK